jgi:uncharacterized protein (DUF305 family)
MSQQGTGTPPAGRPRPPTSATLAFQKETIQLGTDAGIRYSNDPDKDFMTLLAICHKGMAALAHIETQYGKDPAMRQVAHKVLGNPGQPPAAGQTGDGGPATDTTMAYREALGMLQTDAQIRYSNDPDKDFAALMAAYQKAAAGLADIVIKSGKDPAVRKIAEKVRRDATNDADGLKAWIAKHS